LVGGFVAAMGQPPCPESWGELSVRVVVLRRVRRAGGIDSLGGFFDGLEDGREVGQDLRVLEAENGVAVGFEMTSAVCVDLFAALVGGAVELDDEFVGGAIEVEDEAAYGVLAAEPEAV
jgi:hypothetical protein